jgi:hypothetical protein
MEANPPAPTDRTHRIHPRIAREVAVRIEGSDLDGGSFTEDGVTADVSTQGAAIVVRHPVHSGDHVWIEVLATGRRFRGVIRNRAIWEGKYRIGVQLDFPKPGWYESPGEGT